MTRQMWSLPFPDLVLPLVPGDGGLPEVFLLIRGFPPDPDRLELAHPA